MSLDVKKVLGVGASNESATGHIDGMLGYLIKCLFFGLNPTVFTIQK